MKKNVGKLITIEGMDGVGKTTQVRLLEEYLKSRNVEFVSLKEPGSTNISSKIKDILLSNDNREMYPETETYLFAASRSQLVREKIIPALEEGKFVISDRFIDSSLVYQGYVKELGIDKVLDINEIALNKIMPDLTIVLVLDFNISIDKDKELDRIESELQDKDLKSKVNDGYIKLSKMYKNRIVLIDASKSIEEIHQEIIKYVDKFL